MKILIANAFSLSMLDREVQSHRAGDSVYDSPRTPRPCADPVEFLRLWENSGAEVESVVGHADTAAVFAAALGRPVAYNRATIKLSKGILLLVGQYVDPRLPAGATALPDGARIEWWIV